MPENTRYNVTAIWDGRETDFSNSVFLGPSVDIEENEVVSTTVFPNPVRNQLTLQGESLRHVTIYSITGMKLQELDTQGDRVSINMEQLPSGLYLLNIQSDEGYRTVKVMKQ